MQARKLILGEVMTVEVILSQVRWPSKIYRAIRAEAEQRGVSVNSLIVEAGEAYLAAKETQNDKH